MGYNFRCGGGTQNRMTVCLNYDKKPVPEWCDEAEKPEEDQECNKDPCPSKDISIFLKKKMMCIQLASTLNSDAVPTTRLSLLESSFR